MKRYVEPFNLISSDSGYRASTWLANKSRVLNRAAGGIVFSLGDGKIFFLGILEEIVVMMQKQNFEKIVGYRARATTSIETVECVVAKGRFRKLKLPKEIRESVTERGGYMRFLLTGQIHYSEGGLAFGLLCTESSTMHPTDLPTPVEETEIKHGKERKE